MNKPLIDYYLSRSRTGVKRPMTVKEFFAQTPGGFRPTIVHAQAEAVHATDVVRALNGKEPADGGRKA